MTTATRNDALVEAILQTGSVDVDEAQDIADDIIETAAWKDVLAVERRAALTRVRASVQTRLVKGAGPRDRLSLLTGFFAILDEEAAR